MLKAIIFDLDGVIVDSHELHKHAWRTVLHSLGREVQDDELDFVVNGRKRQEIVRHFLGDLPAEQSQRYGLAKQELFRRSAAQLRTIAGAVEFIREAERHGMAMAVATSASRNRAYAMLEQFGLGSYFSAVVTADDVAAGKPDPAVFQIAARKLAIAAENVLVCEDGLAGVEAARRAGMKCLGLSANGRKRLLENAGADWVVEDFTRISVREVQELFHKKAESLI